LVFDLSYQAARRMFKRTRASRLLRLPFKGQLLICTDLHGNLQDFQRMKELFFEHQRRGEDPFLLFTGDLIHGPNCEPEEWPEYLGHHYFDESGALIEEFLQLQSEFPTKVACLLGNHEHSHIGGPHTPKFWPDETMYFEQTIGPKRAARYNRLFYSLPTVAISCCGVAVTHAAPNTVISGPQEVEDLRYEGFERLEIFSMSELPVLGALLWSRHCPSTTARSFLDALGQGGSGLDLVVFGHEIVSEGFERIGDEQLLLSTSFGVRMENKYYLKLDLSHRYRSSQDLQVGRELLRLYT
jgi:hypothetical protein